MPSVPVELQAPDIQAHRRSNTGADFVHTFDSGAPGPHVMVNALTHGNEICGAIVVERLLRRELRPTRGKLTLAFANVEAFFRFDKFHFFKKLGGRLNRTQQDVRNQETNSYKNEWESVLETCCKSQCKASQNPYNNGCKFDFQADRKHGAKVQRK